MIPKPNIPNAQIAEYAGGIAFDVWRCSDRCCAMISGRIATSMSSSSLSPGPHVGLIALAGMEMNFGRLLGHKAELHTFKGLHPFPPRGARPGRGAV